MSIKKDPYDFLGEDITGNMEVKVWSIGSGQVAYSLTDPAVNRVWRPGELKIITFHELYTLNNQPGGGFLLANRLQIRDNKVREALNLPLDPEYLYTEEDAKNLVINGTKEQILDALEFGPVGLASMIKHHAVVHTQTIDRMEFFNTLFSMNIQEIRSSMDKVDETPTAQRERRAAPVEKQEAEAPAKRERKSTPLTPSEPTVQTPTE